MRFQSSFACVHNYPLTLKRCLVFAHSVQTSDFSNLAHDMNATMFNLKKALCVLSPIENVYHKAVCSSTRKLVHQFFCRAKLWIIIPYVAWAPLWCKQNVFPLQAIIASSFIPGYAGFKDLPKIRGRVSHRSLLLLFSPTPLFISVQSIHSLFWWCLVPCELGGGSMNTID